MNSYLTFFVKFRYKLALFTELLILGTRFSVYPSKLGEKHHKLTLIAIDLLATHPVHIPIAMSTKRSSLRLYNDASLGDSLQRWLADQETKLDWLYKHGTKEWNDALQRVHQEALEVNGFSRSEIHRKERDRLPSYISRTIIVLMRRYNIVKKGRKNDREQFEINYDELQIGQSASPKLHPEFLCVCRNKVDSFIHQKARSWKSQGLLRGNWDEVEWDSSTNEWLEPAWNGKINDPKTRVDKGIIAFDGLGEDEKEGMLSDFFRTLNKDERCKMVVRCFQTMERDQQEKLLMSWCKETESKEGNLFSAPMKETETTSFRGAGASLISEIESSKDGNNFGKELPEPPTKMKQDNVSFSAELGIPLQEVVHGNEGPVVDSSVEWDEWMA